MAARSYARRRSTASRAKKEKKESAGSLLRFVFLVAILAWAFRSLIIAPFNIPSASMLPTLYVGDYVAVAKWPYGYSRYSFPFGFPSFGRRILGELPRRGDVVVFRHPGEDADLIKRVIGLPGDIVEMRAGRLLLNGRPVSRRPRPPVKVAISSNSPCKVVAPAAAMVTVSGNSSFCVYHAFLETLPGGPSYTVLTQVTDGPDDNFPRTRVPAGRLFMMGDNRDDSLDSRFPAVEGGIGMVPTENLIGRAMVTFWSTDGSASYTLPWTWFTALRARRIGNGYTAGAR